MVNATGSWRPDCAIATAKVPGRRANATSQFLVARKWVEESVGEGYREHFSEIRSIIRNIDRLRLLLKFDWVVILLINVVQVVTLRNQAFFYYSAGIAILVTWFFRFLLRKLIVWRFKNLF